MTMPGTLPDDSPDSWLSREPLPSDPVAIVEQWLGEAFAARAQENPHAVALATVDADGRPSVRMVLCSDIDARAGRFTMYTNLESRKARALRAEPRAAIVFHWGSRQARIEGVVELTASDQCDAYFASRPLEARLGAWASAQSQPVATREVLTLKLASVAERFGATKESDPVPRPPHWGGLTLVAETVELWISRPGRIHDRAQWRRTDVGTWTATRLQP
jgi:pyridoxamine 5'-phosphate oxidase